jgi:hypothetical protein
MVDNGENILVEFDYDNITLVDPNKVIDENGKVKERYVKQENLVMYANLECSVIPRTKLAIGAPLNDDVRTISVGKINFLNPGFKKFMNTSWSDEITGKDTVKGQGVNQPKLNAVKNPKKSDDYYITQSQYSNGTPGSVDTGLLGIKTINVDINTAFYPTVNITLEDIKGRALFEAGNNSPYAAFFQLPYPIFYLTLKGYYGKAVRYPLMLNTFSSSFDGSSGNFKITLKLVGYKYGIMSYVNWGQMLAVPHMYNTFVNKNLPTNNSGAQTNVSVNNNEVTITATRNSDRKPQLVSRGYQKMKEIYSEYKTKGLIDDDFPEYTVTQLKSKLDKFIKEILEKFSKENLGTLTELDNFQTLLTEFSKKVFFNTNSWFRTYLDEKTPFVLTNESKVYTYKKDYNTPEKRTAAETELDGILKEFVQKLSTNSVAGKNGSYNVSGKITKSQVPIDVDLKKIKIDVTDKDINFSESYKEIFGKNASKSATTATTVVDEFRQNYTPIINNSLFYSFDGKGRFNEIIEIASKNVTTLRSEIEQKITDSLAEQLSRKDSGIGFKPTIRNMLAPFFAQGEAFIRLMDDVHTKAWEVRENPYRQAAVLGGSSTAQSVDVKRPGQTNEPIYPWPQVLREYTANDGNEKFEQKYPGDPSISSLTKAYIPELWPEVEFVEEYIKGFIEREEPEPEIGDTNNGELKPNRLSLNSVDFPITNEVFQNKEESKFYYEIYERVMVNAFYSKLSRQSGYQSSVYLVESENEKLNVLKSLGSESPFLQKKLKQYLIDGGNFTTFLRHISNQGEGESWQKFIRGEIVTPYLKNKVDNPTQIFNKGLLSSEKSQPSLSLTQANKITDYLENLTSSNEFDFTDMYPITNLGWSKKYLANGKSVNGTKELFNTNKVLKYNTIHKTVTNFSIDDTTTTKRPVTNYNYTTNIFSQTINTDLKEFYNNRKIEEQFITEGNVNYTNYNAYLTDTQTTSILNTPFFINSIQNGVFNFRYKSNDLSPYKAAAYYFINSLPLATLREKYKDLESNTELDYIMSTLKKFGGVHRLPYAWILKYGSIWHRYKTWNRKGTDILDESWNDFNYLSNYDPSNSASTKTFTLNINNQQKNIILTDNITNGSNTVTTMNIGFYPKLIDDMNVFLQGLKLFSGTTQLNGTATAYNDILVVETINDNNLLPGQILAGPGVELNTTVVTQLSGVTGGVGIYKVSPAQNPTALNGICSITGTTMDVLSITGGTLSVNQKIVGQNLEINTKILSQVSGTTGGVGRYTIDISQNVTTSNFFLSNPQVFYVTNASTAGYSQGEVQTLLDDGKMVLATTIESKIVKPTGFDNSDNGRSLNLSTWSVLTKNNTNDQYFIIPSFGNTINQINDECFKNNNLKIEITNNPALFNGSVRMFWGAPNYGYFDLTKITKPDPSSYMKEIFPDKAIQQNFSLNGDNKKYNKISEIFTTFETEVLDYFEEEFLNFSRSIYDYNTLIAGEPGEETELEIAFKNFQYLMRQLMVIEKPTNLQNETLVDEVIKKQNENFQKVLSKFMEYDVALKMGNPTMYDKRLFYTFSTKFIEDPISYQGYNQGTPGSLPTNGGSITLAQSKTSNPQTWKDLEYYVGFSEIPELVYSDNGSYITDFFVDMNVQFTEKNVKDFAPIIKLYATQKLNNKNINVSEFFTLMNTYLDTTELYLNNVLNDLMTGIRNDLPEIVVTNEGLDNKAPLQGNQSRDELWDSFKSLNDTWVAGADLKTKTIFEDLLLFDRASRDIGQKVLIDIFKVKDMIETGLVKNSWYNIISTILQENNFTIFPLPAFTNFYNVQDAVKNPVPKAEGSLEFANSFWGTFLNVDYRNTSPKILCYYNSKPSNHLAMNENADYRYRDDAFDLRRASDNPLLENQLGKNNWDKSNKIVGFNVDVSVQNQQIFESFTLNQDAGQPTAESLEMINQMANQSRNRGTATQSVSLYNIYKNRSYTCSVDMMGNALIQPMMYFNLRNVPMFSGPYMITKVSHSISEGTFSTSFTGTRQPFYSLPKIDNFIQSLSVNLISKIKEQLQKEENERKSFSGNVITETTNVVSNVLGTEKLTSNQNCADKLNAAYIGFTTVDTPKVISKTAKEMDTVLKNRLINIGLKTGETRELDLRQLLFIFFYLDSGNPTGFSAYENNFGSVSLTETYGPSLVNYIDKKYFCVSKSNNTNVPTVSFPTIEDFVDFAISKINPSIGSYSVERSLQNAVKQYVNLWASVRNPNVYTKLTEQDKTNIENKARQGLQVFDSLNPI